MKKVRDTPKAREIEFEQVQKAWERVVETRAEEIEAQADALEAFDEFQRLWELYFKGRENESLQ